MIHSRDTRSCSLLRTQRGAFAKRPSLRPCALAAAVLAVMGANSGSAAWAQSSAPEALKLNRVEVTGSSIKRLDGETALPIQTLKRDDIDKTGATTAAEIMRSISGNAAGLTDGASITDSTGGQRGFNGANLRGIGVSSTLILLNGRRLANFASPGDAAGVDLNNIPAGAIERVEVLKDGASAIYGTDAIGGVINFITRKDYQGIDLNAYTSSTQEGGAGKRTASVAAGMGDIERDRFNVFGVLDVQQLDSLRSTQRKFLQERKLGELLPFYTSSRTFPANIDLPSSASSRKPYLEALTAAGYLFNGKPFTDRRINLMAPGCNPPATISTSPTAQACSYDYMKDTEIYPEAEKISFLGRGVLQLNADTQAFAELMLSHAKTLYVLSPGTVPVSGVPLNAFNSTYLKDRPINFAGTVGLRMRDTEFGNRSNEVSSDAQRLVLGVSGVFAKDWDYSLGLSVANNSSADRYVNGYFLFDKFDAAIKSGKVNPFGESNAEGKALINAMRISDEARKSKGSTTGLDGKITGTLGELAGGSIGLALGAELRRESQQFTPSALLISNNIAGDRDSALPVGTPDSTIRASRFGRNIASAFAEVSAPFTKELEGQAALRYDHYQGVGSTVNPKLGLRYQPSKTLLLRGSAGTGFRAPTFSELYRPTVYGSSPAFVYDSVYDDFDQYPTIKQANPNLKPEKSKQLSFGVAIEPINSLTLSADYWSIRKTDVISDLREKTILENPTRYAKYITRDNSNFGRPTLLLAKENQGQLRTSGVDVEANYRGAATAMGRFSAGFSGTYVIEYKRQFGELEPLVSNVGKFLNDQVIQRWRHRASVEWDQGPFNVTLGNTYYAGYTDDNYLADTVPGRVPAYSLWDLSASYRATPQLKLRVGVQNLFDKQPPFSNQSYYFLSMYDPTYTDPKGRTFFASVNYSFK